MVAEGGVLRAYPTQGRARSEDNCNARFNYDRPQDVAASQGARYTWSLRQGSDGEPRLWIGIGDAAPNSEFLRAQ
jgi:hypothetical protein